MRNMLKMTRGERIGAIVLLCALFVLILTRTFILPIISKPESISRLDSMHIEEFARFRDSLRDNRVRYNNSYTPKENSYILSGFDPNLSDSLTLINLGIRPYVVSNIIRYRLKGGEFRTKQALSRIYGLSNSKYRELEPYIEIDTTRFIKPKLDRDTIKSYKFDEVTPVDLNRCDTALLRKIPGIGVGYANMIVNYRERLGGFVDESQLREINNIPDSVINMLMNGWAIIEEPEVRGIELNKYGIDRLRAHPYINFYQARAIVELRKKRGRINTLSELSMLDEFSDEDIDRLSGYLIFDKY